ncbi:MAG: hypothetical protein PW843_26275 [Azospirillaceae bacterium]|nr:hypothetical protein [Azospirillaceae bacterium]
MVQRLPVKIVLEPGQDGAAALRVGLSVITQIDTTAKGNGK